MFAMIVPAISAADTIVNMTANGFVPQTITVQGGGDTIIVFKNVDTKAHWPASNIHPTHRLYPATDIKNCGSELAGEMFDACRGIGPGESYVTNLKYSGDWPFHDHLNPELTGSVVATGTSTADTKKTSTSLWQRLANFVSLTYMRAKYALKKSSKVIWAGTSMIDIAANEEPSLARWLQILGTKRVMDQVNKEESATRRDCHQSAHSIGRKSYELFGNKVFSICSAECHSGCYHGASEAYVRDNGTDNLEQSLSVICDSSLNPFFSHQCFHGVGHRLMAWSGYDLNKALDTCDKLPSMQGSCYTGTADSRVAYTKHGI